MEHREGQLSICAYTWINQNQDHKRAQCQRADQAAENL